MGVGWVGRCGCSSVAQCASQGSVPPTASSGRKLPSLPPPPLPSFPSPPALTLPSCPHPPLPPSPSADAMRPHRSRTPPRPRPPPPPPLPPLPPLPPPGPPWPPPSSSPPLRSPRHQLRPTRRAAVACWRRLPRRVGSAPARSCRRRGQAPRRQRAVRRRAGHVAARRPGATDRARAGGGRGEREANARGLKGKGEGDDRAACTR